MVTIIDYGAGNIGSIVNMIRRVGYDSIVSSNPDDIRKADKLILPGVGSFNHGMSQLNKSGLVEVLNQKVLEEKIPILGICLGAQLFTNGSEEGDLRGLGWFDAEVNRFKFDLSSNLKTPHMGWNLLDGAKKSRLLNDLPLDPRFYFVHSYYLNPKNESDILATTTYGHKFVAALEKDNIIGCQFHPEKSHKFGMKIIKNFIENY